MKMIRIIALDIAIWIALDVLFTAVLVAILYALGFDLLARMHGKLGLVGVLMSGPTNLVMWFARRRFFRRKG